MNSGELKKMYIKRENGFQCFHLWEKKNPQAFTFKEALAGLDFLYSLLPVSARERQFDPEGVMIMRKALSVLQPDIFNKP